MDGLFVGRIANVREKSYKDGNKYYLLSFVQGEGKQYVEVSYIFSKKKYEVGEQKLILRPKLYNGKVVYNSID